MFFLPRKLKVDGNKCRSKSENTFFTQVAKDKSHESCKISLATIYFRGIFFSLLFLPLKYRNNKNTLDKKFNGKNFYFSGNFENFQFWKVIH